ncbi:MAG: hypothetical protein RBR59_07800 [Sulfurimonadaceae bacterium]|jgi:hypothetical protein|nr:hypothetical protein [Sulfurimonadaceae bacterium]
MQSFGKFSTNFDQEYLTEHYVYTPLQDEKISIEELEVLLKNKRKTVAGTIILHNPTEAPVKFASDKSLKSQGYEIEDVYVELAENPLFYLLTSALKEHYKGKVVEIKYLFNLNRPHIDAISILEDFDGDIAKLPTSQFTRYDRTFNYIDVPNIRLSGKFVYFGCGHKYERHLKDTIHYARSLCTQAQKLGKEVSFMYDNNCDEQEAKESAYFLAPIATGKLKDTRANLFKEAFKTNPPSIKKMP